MADEPQVIRGIDWKATFPFVSLFRGFRVAIHPSKLILALVALMLIYFGGKALDSIWPADSSAVPAELALYGESQASVQPSDDFTAHRAAARKGIEDTYKDHLKSIGKPDGNLGDIKWFIKDQLKKQVDGIKDSHQKQIDAINDSYSKRADKDKTADAERERDASVKAVMLDRDSQISLAYSGAADAWQESKLIKGVGLFDTFCGYELGMLNQMVGAVRDGNWLGPMGVVDAIRAFFVFAPVWAMHYHYVFFTIFFLYFLCVWSIFGGAIARIAAVHVARDEKISIRQALRFSTSKFLSFLSAPIIPLLIIVAVGLVISVGGFLANIPFIGPIVIGIFFFLALIAGFVMTLVLLGTGGGFNLMYPTVAVEGSDSFDAISRSFSYLYARPWRMAFYSGVSILYGSICYLFVRYFLFLMLSLTHKFVGLLIFRSAENMAPIWSAMWPSPSTLGRLSYDVNYLPLGSGEAIGAFLIMVWVTLAIGLLGAFAMSFYFSANTIIYFLMRHEVDATELDDVYLEQSDDEFADTAATAPATMTVTTTTTTVTEVPAPTTAPAETPGNNGGANGGTNGATDGGANGGTSGETPPESPAT